MLDPLSEFKEDLIALRGLDPGPQLQAAVQALRLRAEQLTVQFPDMGQVVDELDKIESYANNSHIANDPAWQSWFKAAFDEIAVFVNSIQVASAPPPPPPPIRMRQPEQEPPALSKLEPRQPYQPLPTQPAEIPWYEQPVQQPPAEQFTAYVPASQRQPEQPKETWTCSHGHVNLAGTKWCGQCGEAREELTWRCFNCGAINEANRNFCMECGSKKSSKKVTTVEEVDEDSGKKKVITTVEEKPSGWRGLMNQLMKTPAQIEEERKKKK